MISWKQEKKKKGTSRVTKSKRQWQSLRGSLLPLQLCPPRDPSPSPAGPSHDPQTSLWRILPREFPRPLVGLIGPQRWSTLTHTGDRECRGDGKCPQNLRGYLQINLHIHETHAMTSPTGMLVRGRAISSSSPRLAVLMHFDAALSRLISMPRKS